MEHMLDSGFSKPRVTAPELSANSLELPSGHCVPCVNGARLKTQNQNYETVMYVVKQVDLKIHPMHKKQHLYCHKWSLEGFSNS